ncbi:MAG TPA: carbohydrate ABC transporter permease [Candidatus Acidoferrales bacterium]|jgi:alpha-glucoside transport system permease protein|nr:carbohydrate ABC transporter permease [Candidatus Acidoferrales bacterium]
MTGVPVAVTVKAKALPARRPRPGRILVHLATVLIVVAWLLPTLGMLVSSLRPPEDVARSAWWTALSPTARFTTDNYTHVFQQSDLGNALLNSLFITIPSTIIPVTIAAFAAYAFAWMTFPGRDLLFVTIVGLLVVPLQATILPILNVFGALGVTGNGSIATALPFLGVWLAHTGYGLPFAIYLLRNYMGGLPREVFESAAIDGAGPVTAFFRLAIPMSVPALAALVIFQFLFVWNDLFVALMYIGASNGTRLPLTLLLANLTNSHGGGVQYLMAAAFISMALPLVVFFGFQRYFVRGLTGGAVKG